MNILMMTNTFTPHVGGVARSVKFFTEEYRKAGHRVVVVAPEFENMPMDEADVVRMPAIQNFNGSDFSVVIPVPRYLMNQLEDFQPDVVHSHHPFLLGASAVRVANHFNRPLVFTHHTLYEKYTHYVPGDSPQMKEFAIELSTGYANLCDHVVAPSASVAEILRERGVEKPITCIPTGVHVDEFSDGDGERFRKQMNITADALVVGHLGRLAPEKNLPFLARAAARFLEQNDEAWFVVVGSGPSESEIRSIFMEAGLLERLVMPGSLSGQDLVDAYHAMDVFAFASQTETQGMVLVEAMAAGVPVVAVDASGAREVVADKKNGRLLDNEDESEFAAALSWFARLDEAGRRGLREEALKTAENYSMRRCGERMLDLYEQLRRSPDFHRDTNMDLWEGIREQIKTQWDLITNLANAAGSSLTSATDQEKS